jgi:hypothetical protein
LRNAGVGREPALLVGAALLGALLSFIGLLAQRSETLPDDSPKFVAALEDWSPVIENTHATPRALKRFVNRIRYFAMQQMAEANPPSMYRRWAEWISAKCCGMPLPISSADEPENIPEDILVALAAINAAGTAARRDPFSPTNISVTFASAASHYVVSQRSHDTSGPRFEELYPLARLEKYQAEFLRLAAGAQPK